MKTHLMMLTIGVAMASVLGGCTLFDFSREEPEKVTYTTIVTCEVRLVRVSDGAIMASASDYDELDDLDDLAESLADDLEDGKAKEGKAVAVASLRNRTGSKQCRQLADELQEKLIGELTNSGYFVMRERLELRAILDEKDLESSSVVRNPKVQSKLANVDYLLLGGVSVRQEED